MVEIDCLRKDAKASRQVNNKDRYFSFPVNLTNEKPKVARHALPRSIAPQNETVQSTSKPVSAY